MNFTESVEKFLANATYLDDTDLPMVTALRKAAEELDTTGVQAALLNTFGVTYRTLAKRSQGDGQAKDEAEAFLDAL